jgi:hypothetical protein
MCLHCLTCKSSVCTAVRLPGTPHDAIVTAVVGSQQVQERQGSRQGTRVCDAVVLGARAQAAAAAASEETAASAGEEAASAAGEETSAAQAAPAPTSEGAENGCLAACVIGLLTSHPRCPSSRRRQYLPQQLSYPPAGVAYTTHSSIACTCPNLKLGVAD